MADAPLTPLVMGGRFGVAREKSGVPSAFPFGQTLACGGRFRGAVLGQPFKSPAADIALPFVEAFEMTVDVDELDEVDATDDDELVRWMVLRVPNMLMPLTSSTFIEFNV